MAFPIAKLGFLLMKQLSKPLANFIKNEAKSHPFFRKHVCMPPARVYYWVDMHIKLHSKGRWKSISYAQLTEEEQVELGADLLGEVILFSLLSVILLAELSRQGDKKAIKERMKDEEMSNIGAIVSNLVNELNQVKKSQQKLEKRLASTFDDVLQFEHFEYEPYQKVEETRRFWKFPSKEKKIDYDYVEAYDPFSP